jgi:hypothetical protein
VKLVDDAIKRCLCGQGFFLFTLCAAAAQWRSEGCTCAIKWIVCDAPNAPAAYMEALVAKMLGKQLPAG